jgi:hypothetical protein
MKCKEMKWNAVMILNHHSTSFFFLYRLENGTVPFLLSFASPPHKECETSGSQDKYTHNRNHNQNDRINVIYMKWWNKKLGKLTVCDIKLFIMLFIPLVRCIFLYQNQWITRGVASGGCGATYNYRFDGYKIYFACDVVLSTYQN